MRKFTKEIASLLATVTVGATVNATYVSSEEWMAFTGQNTNSDGEEEFVPTAGVDVVTLPATTTTTAVGTYVAEQLTTTTMPPVAGGFVFSEPTTTTAVTTTLPPLEGTYVASRMTTTSTSTTIPAFVGTVTGSGTTNIVTTTTTTTTTTEELPPLMGDVAYVPGDVNGDLLFNVADIVALQRYILNMPGAKINDWYSADLCSDGEINIFDVVVMRRELLTNMRYSDTSVVEK